MIGRAGNHPDDIEISEDGLTATVMLRMPHPGENLIDSFTLEDLDVTRALIGDEATRVELARFFAIVQTFTWPGYEDVEIDEIAAAALELESETLAKLEELASISVRDINYAAGLHELALWTDVARVMREVPIPRDVGIQDILGDNPELHEIIRKIVEARDGELDDRLDG
jgi:hypothetical protein